MTISQLKNHIGNRYGDCVVIDVIKSKEIHGHHHVVLYDLHTQTEFTLTQSTFEKIVNGKTTANSVLLNKRFPCRHTNYNQKCKVFNYFKK